SETGAPRPRRAASKRSRTSACKRHRTFCVRSKSAPMSEMIAKSAIVTIVCLLSVGFAQSQGEAQKPGAGIEEIKRAFYQEDYSLDVSPAAHYLNKFQRSTMECNL